MNKFLSIAYLFITTSLFGQTITPYADSIRLKYNIPELAFAVVSSDSVYEMAVIGFQRKDGHYEANLTDKFRLGSNTKAITGFIAAQLVKENKIQWNTKFFDLFPELKETSNPAYHELTLINLLTFRTRLFPYTYTYPEPTKEQFSGNEEEQRYQFTKWFFQQTPVTSEGDYHFSNLGYTASGLMLEKVSGKTYKELVSDLGKLLDITFYFGTPNTIDTLQPWGHDGGLNMEPPFENHKLNWLLAGGNISVSLPDYIKFIQLQLQGLNGQSVLFTKEEFEFLHFGFPRFSVGWFWLTDENNGKFSYNIGNPGTFLSKVYVFPETNKAFIFFVNAQTDEADAGINELFEMLIIKYGS